MLKTKQRKRCRDYTEIEKNKEIPQKSKKHKIQRNTTQNKIICTRGREINFRIFTQHTQKEEQWQYNTYSLQEIFS